MFAKTSISKVACIAAGSLMLQSCITSAPKAVVTDASVTEAKLAIDSVTNSKIATGAVTTGKLADSAVTTAKILDGAVTTAKLGTIPVSTFTNFIANGGQAGAITAGTSDATAFQLQTSGVTRMTLASTGLITGGHTNTSTANGTNAIGIFSSMSANPAANSSSNFFGGLGRADWQAAFTSSTDLAGGFFDSGQVVGLRGHVLNSAGNPAVITRGIGVDAFVELTSNGNIATAAGFHADGSIGVGTIDTYVGLWLEDITNTTSTAFGTTRYGVFSDGAAVSFFLGNVGIGAGQTNPGDALSVTGNINATVALEINGTSMCTAAGCTAVSDENLKTDIKPLEGSLEKILKLHGISYTFKDKKTYGKGAQIGFSAQDLEKVFPQVVHQAADSEIKTVSYGHLIAPLVEAFQELYSKWNADHKALGQQQEKIASLERKVELENLALKAENRALKNRLEKIELALAQAAPDKSIQKKGRKLAQVK